MRVAMASGAGPMPRMKIGLACCALGIGGTAVAQDAADMGDITRQLSEQNARLNELSRVISEQERELNNSKRQLQDQQRRIDQLLQRYSGRGAPTTSVQSENTAVSDAATLAQADPTKPVGKAPEKKDARPQDVATIFQQPGVLTPRGRFVIEPSLQYAHSTNNQVALVGFTVIPAITIGLIDIRRISRDIFTGAITTRYGLTNRMEVEAKVPYVYRHDSTLTRSIGTPSVTDSQFDTSGKNLGDVEFTVRYQLNEGGADKPYYVGSLRLKTRTGTSPYANLDPGSGLATKLPTGSGFYGIQPGITALIPSDPAVFFGGINYLYSFERDVGNGFGTIKPGGILGFNFGMGLSLNERATVSIGYDHAVVMKSTQKSVGTQFSIGPTSTAQLGTFLLGYSFRMSNRSNLNLSLGVGATREAPDLQLMLRYPMTF